LLTRGVVWCVVCVCVAYVCIVSCRVVRSLCAEVCNMRNLRELTLEGNEGLAELPDLSFFPSLQVLRVPTTKRYPIPRYRPDPASRLACSPASSRQPVWDGPAVIYHAAVAAET